MKTNSIVNCFVFSAVLAVAGCGGGGGGGGGGTSDGATIGGNDSTNVTTFKLRDAYALRVKSGYHERFVATFGDSFGICTGTLELTGKVATAAMFQGVTTFAQTQKSELRFNDDSSCDPRVSRNIVEAGVAHFNVANFAFIGSEVSNGTATSNDTKPLPTDVKVGDRGIYKILNTTTIDSESKIINLGRRDIDYVIEADSTSSTAIVNFVTRIYQSRDPLALPTSTEEARYRIDNTTGRLTPVSGKVVFNGNTQLTLTNPQVLPLLP